eukprot:3941534-Rhodomonas_salina.2
MSVRKLPLVLIGTSNKNGRRTVVAPYNVTIREHSNWIRSQWVTLFIRGPDEGRDHIYPTRSGLCTAVPGYRVAPPAQCDYPGPAVLQVVLLLLLLLENGTEVES